MRVPFTKLDVSRSGVDVVSERLPVQSTRTYSETGLPPAVADSAPQRAFARVETQSRGVLEKAVSAGAAGMDGRGIFDEFRMGGPDINPELLGRQKFEVYHEMASTDPAIRSLLHMYMLPIRAADWGMKPPKDDPDGDDIARARMGAAASNFGLEEKHGWLDLTWDGWLQQTMAFLKYGCMGEEIVWGDVREWRDEDGDVHLVRPISRFAPRYPGTVLEIEDDPRTGRITRIIQDLKGADWIPGSKLAWYVMEPEGTWWGQSLLRTPYGAWLLKKGLLLGSAIGFDRFGVGVPLIRHPEGEAAKAKAAAIAREYRTSERAWIALEGAPPPEGDWSFEILSGAQSVMDAVPMLRHYDQQIAMAGLQQFSALGVTETGSRAVGDVLSDPYYLAVQAVAKYIAGQRMRVALRRFYDVNFGVDVPVPEITVQKIQGRNVAVLAQALADLASAGFSFTDRGLQNDVRDILDLPHMPEPLRRAIGALPDDVGIVDEIENEGEPAAAPVEGGSVAVPVG